MIQKKMQFGGTWTEQKLDMLEGYLSAWANVMKKQPFERIYLDAFAGTGYREGSSSPDLGFFSADLIEDEAQRFLDGSARIALRVRPAFHRFLFVEKSASRHQELLKLSESFADLAGRIDCRLGDCNHVLSDFCRHWNSRAWRGVLFLDPFGMQVDWTTMEAVAATKAIDVWILFPLGIGVNRMLPRDGSFPDGWRARLDRFFGDPGWHDAFYRPSRIKGLFDEGPRIEKTATFNAISEYYQERLRSIFADVAPNPRVLHNTNGSPLFLLCFAIGNPSENAKAAALRIATHILGKS